MAEVTPLLPLSSVIGNQRPRRLLAGALAAGRLFPALLLHGPAGIGKFTAARALAAALNCTAPDGADACGTCASCRKVSAWSHPDIKVLESEADAQQSGRPLFFPDPQASSRSGGKPSARLLIGQVRRLLHETQFRPFEGGRRVLIVRHLESDPSMGCANALLKSLEEPPPGTSFILTSARPDRLPDTIRSRCQVLAFLPPSRDETSAFLRDRGIPAEEADLRTALSGGRPGVALALDAANGLELRDGILAALDAATAGEALDAVLAADALAPAAGEMPGLLALFALVARDLMVLPADPDHLLLTNRDRMAELEQLAASISTARAARLVERIHWCEQALERHVNPGLMLQTLLLEAGGHLPLDPLAAPWLEAEGAQA
jgi:DNA polymerase-3 subunit delta'